MGFFNDLFGGSAKRAAQIQADASDRAIAEQRQARETARADLAPFTNIGGEVLNPLLEFVMKGPESGLERTQGFSDIQKSAAARGKLVSGGTLEGLTGFNNMLNERNRGQRFNEMFALANLGQNSAAGQANASILSGRGIADTQVGKGDALASGVIGAHNQRMGLLGGIGSFLGTKFG